MDMSVLAGGLMSTLIQNQASQAKSGSSGLGREERAALDGDRIIKAANELKALEEMFTKNALITPKSIEIGVALTRARWALIGFLNDSWAATATRETEDDKKTV